MTGMDSGIGATGNCKTVAICVGVENLLQNLEEAALHGSKFRLFGPAVEVGAVVGEVDFKANESVDCVDGLVH
jgi:hypothetical protein